MDEIEADRMDGLINGKVLEVAQEEFLSTEQTTPTAAISSLTIERSQEFGLGQVVMIVGLKSVSASQYNGLLAEIISDIPSDEEQSQPLSGRERLGVKLLEGPLRGKTLSCLPQNLISNDDSSTVTLASDDDHDVSVLERSEMGDNFEEEEDGETDTKECIISDFSALKNDERVEGECEEDNAQEQHQVEQQQNEKQEQEEEEGEHYLSLPSLSSLSSGLDGLLQHMEVLHTQSIEHEKLAVEVEMEHKEKVWKDSFAPLHREDFCTIGEATAKVSLTSKQLIDREREEEWQLHLENTEKKYILSKTPEKQQKNLTARSQNFREEEEVNADLRQQRLAEAQKRFGIPQYDYNEQLDVSGRSTGAQRKIFLNHSEDEDEVQNVMRHKNGQSPSRLSHAIVSYDDNSERDSNSKNQQNKQPQSFWASMFSCASEQDA